MASQYCHLLVISLVLLLFNTKAVSEQLRARDIGITPGILSPGPLNAITDVDGVRVGHLTLIEGESIRTGVTAIMPHGGNLYQNKVPIGLAVGNGFGKLMGSTQINELGELETPIVLTNTLSVPRAADAIITWTLKQPGNSNVRSVNAVVGETNDAFLNDIRARAIKDTHVLKAIETASPGTVAEGSVGAATGTRAFGWKGGIGTSSRRLPKALGGYVVGVLVQSNYGGVLAMDGVPIGKALGGYYLQKEFDKGDADGSIMIIVATDAPLSDRNLKRLANRAMAGLARTGAAFTNGSGDYALAFSTALEVRRTSSRREQMSAYKELPNKELSPLSQATIEATEEAIYNSLLMATTVSSRHWQTGQIVTLEALPINKVKTLLDKMRGP